MKSLLLQDPKTESFSTSNKILEICLFNLKEEHLTFMLLHPSLPAADGPAQAWGPLLISPCPGDQKLRKIQDMGTKPSPVKACHEKREESHESHTRTCARWAAQPWAFVCASAA